MKKIATTLALLLVFGGLAFAQTAYDRDVSVKVMRDNASLLGQLRTAASRNEFQTAAEKLMLMAQGMAKLLPMAPPKGDKGEWESSIRKFLEAAYRGIGACGTKDSAALNAAVAELLALNKSGHASFR